jgi:hypothetical protein
MTTTAPAPARREPPAGLEALARLAADIIRAAALTGLAAPVYLTCDTQLGPSVRLHVPESPDIREHLAAYAQTWHGRQSARPALDPGAARRAVTFTRDGAEVEIWTITHGPAGDEAGDQ